MIFCCRHPLICLLLAEFVVFSTVKALSPGSIKFSRMECTLSVNSYHGEVKVTIDAGDGHREVMTQWQKDVAQENYMIPITSDYQNSVYQSHWYDRHGEHITAIYSPMAIGAQGQMEVRVSAFTSNRNLCIKKLFRPQIAMYPLPMVEDVDAIEATEVPDGSITFRQGSSMTLTYKYKVRGEVSYSVHLGKVDSSNRHLLNYNVVQDNDPTSDIVVTSNSVDIGNGLKEHEVSIQIPRIKQTHEGRVKVHVMRAYEQANEESITFLTDLTKSPRQSIFQGHPMKIHISACNPRFVNYDSNPIQITMTRGLPNCVYCTVGGYPAPGAAEFFQGGYPVSSGQYHSSYWYTLERDTIQAVFSIQHTINHYEGRFKCKAYSGRQEIETEFEIVLQ